MVGSKEEGKVLKDKACIYYLVIIKLLKKTRAIPINDLIGEIKMGTKEFTEELAEKSGIDGEKEELLGVENIIKVVDLERKLSVMEVDLEDEKKLHEEIVKQKDKQLNQKDKQLNQKDKKIEEKDKEIKLLKKELERK